MSVSSLSPEELNLLGHLKLRNRAMAIRARCRHQIVANGRVLTKDQTEDTRRWATQMIERANVGIQGIKVATGRFSPQDFEDSDTDL